MKRSWLQWSREAPAPLQDWAEDHERRSECHVPEDVKHRTKWQIALDMLDAHGGDMPHGWIAGDDEFGRVQAFRKGLRERRERYVLDVPCDEDCPVGYIER